MKLHQAGKLKEAEKLYRRIIKVAPRHADALNYLGILLHQTKRSEESIDLLKRSVASSPDYADAHNNLGLVFKETERFKEAAKAFDACLAIRPNHANALNNYGTVFRAQKEYEKAIEYYNRAVQFDPKLSDAYFNLGYSLKKLKRTDDAIAAYRKAVDLGPYDPVLYKSLGTLLYAEKREKEAIELFERWLDIDPENPTARHLHAGFSGEHVPTQASREYITQTFDSFASTFDEVLEELEYRGPELVAEAAANYAASEERQMDILDAGCGTGLVAPLVQGFAKSIEGVDLSPGMIGKARSLEIYSALHVKELTGFMHDQAESYDMVLMVDTLIYFGSLRAVFHAVHETLKVNGCFVFTVEKLINPVPGESFRLNPHGRYSHGEEYVQTCLREMGFKPHSTDEHVLRFEADEPVSGLVVVASRC